MASSPVADPINAAQATQRSSDASEYTRASATTPRPRPTVSVVLPCLNEEDGVATAVADALVGLQRAQLDGEVIVADNGSSDLSAELAEAAGARVVVATRRGTGAATLAGVAAAEGDVIVTADADGTYDLENLGDLVNALDEADADLVIGNRMANVDQGAMPWLHRRIGTPSFNLILRVLSGVRVTDSHSGYRAFRRSAVQDLSLQTPGFESVTELLLRAQRRGWTIEEVPTHYRRRLGPSKLRSFPDGWRHLWMLLVLSPHATLLIPGLMAVGVGFVLAMIPLVRPDGLVIAGIHWAPVFVGPMCIVLGAQAALVGAVATHRARLSPQPILERLAWLDRGDAVDRLLRAFAVIAAAGVVTDAVLFVVWASGHQTDRMLSFAGLAQAAIVVGLGGIVSLLSADYSREALS